jgi:nitrous-oxide reductase
MVLLLGGLLAIGAACGGGDDGGNGNSGSGNADLDAIAQARGLTPEDMKHALQQFVPPGKYDDYVMFASGGHSGQVFAIGMPSMRILKEIAVFTPEPWQGYGTGSDLGATVLAEGNPAIPEGTDLTWATRTTLPSVRLVASTMGAGSPINDRATHVLAMVDLTDWRTKQIVPVPNAETSHGGMFVTPNSEYVHISSKFPMPWPAGSYADLTEYKDKYRGVSAWMKIDPNNGKINLAESFEIELPPYSQDLADSGKLVSDGWGFIGSWNTEMATGGDLEGGQPLEAGASQNNFDFLHVINWKKAAEVPRPKAWRRMASSDQPSGCDRRRIDLPHPEPKSPHGADVDPTGATSSSAAS